MTGSGPNDTILAVGEQDLARARDWLARHGARGDPPSRLLAARLAVRAGARQTGMLLIVGIGLLIVGWAALVELIDFSWEVGPSGTELRGALEMSVAYLLLSLVTWWTCRRQWAGERRIARALPRRVAHSARTGVLGVVGGWYVLAAAVTYGGGLAIGLGVVALSGTAEGRVLGAVIAAGTLGLGALAAVVVAEAVRRPALAEDDLSLRADDLLRTEDAHVMPPFPLLVALVASIAAAASAAVTFVLLGYVVVGAVAWAVMVLADHRRPLGSSQRPVGVH
jgi:hypothetical protein